MPDPVWPERTTQTSTVSQHTCAPPRRPPSPQRHQAQCDTTRLMGFNLPIASSAFAEILEALASLAWPGVLLAFLFLFRSELNAVIKRLSRFKGPGFEVELGEQLDKLGEATKEASESLPSPKQPTPGTKLGGDDETSGGDAVPTPPSKPPSGGLDGMAIDRDVPHAEAEGEDIEIRPTPIDEQNISLASAPDPSMALWTRIDQILREAAESPRAALIGLSVEIERKSREILVSRGDSDAARPGRPLARQLSLLDLSPPTQRAASEFRRVRNLIVHGHGATDGDALRAIDLGLQLLTALESIPHEVNYVEVPFTDTFADAEGTKKHDFGAVVLRSLHPPAKDEELRAFPITQTNLPAGEALTWEWNMQQIYPEAWYRDPRSGDLVYGWTESAEFTGRPIHLVDSAPAWIDRLS